MVYTNYNNRFNFLEVVSVVMVFLSRNVLLYIFETFVLGIYQNLEDISQKNS